MLTESSRASAKPPPRAAPWQRGGFVPLVRVHASHTAGDALVAVSLAGSLFFSVPVGEARGKVALYLLTSMAPFAIVAPVIGPLLDRARSGRRTAIVVTLVARGALTWLMADTVGLALYPLAFGVLVFSKGYGVARSAAVPRLLPEELSLVAANARLSATGVVTGAAGAGLGAAVIALSSANWSLRLATVVFAASAVLALRLPAAVNSPAAELPTGVAPAARRLQWTGHLRTTVVATVSLRALAGYLTMFLAFLLRSQGVSTLQLGLVVAAGATGSMLGTGLGVGLRARAPEALLTASLAVASAGCTLAALSFSLRTAALAAAASGLAGSLGKLSLDSILQRDIDDELRGQAFARSETALQLAWVAGGALGIVLPLRGGLGLGLAAVAMCAATTSTALSRRT
ncbi:MAG TPA: MFS transporter [Mycobacteriales bacterium]|nr:MFS transporter [Mycobacteriales bacterium]